MYYCVCCRVGLALLGFGRVLWVVLPVLVHGWLFTVTAVWCHVPLVAGVLWGFW